MLLELGALLEKLEQVAADGDRERYDADERYRWVIHRLWIAAGNEAAVLERMTTLRPRILARHAP